MKIIFLTLIFLLTNSVIFGQTITGMISDEYNQPIQGANILNKNTDHHTHSNGLGKFTLENCSIGDTLKISFIDYQSEVFVLNNLSNSLKIELKKKVITLEEIVMSPKIDALQIVTDIDLQTNPVNSSQDILRKVSGLFIGQHAGGGKAEQIFLRGFDIDHGTDINITIDGLPVNMVSHAHGQGYADLHFVIPETVNKIDFGKGSYYQDQGNFTTAGYVDFQTKDRLDNSSVKMEVGQFDTYRLLGMFNLLKSSNHNAFIASEFLSTDGYFISPQNFHRINLFGKYAGEVSSRDHLEVSTSYFDSKWDASGQIPQRSVDDGSITRFGAIDDTEGGATSRNNFMVKHTKVIDDRSFVKSSAYLSEYNFELYSNFTFFLEDTVNGDQIRQKENRLIYGLNTEYNRSFSTERINGNWQAGLSLRNDRSRDNELSHTMNRSTTLDRIRLGDINETNIGAYLGTEIDVKKWTLNPSVRVDYFDFQYNDHLDSLYRTQGQTKAIISPKFNVLYNPNEKVQLYLKTGKGFHSNDTRVVVAQGGEEILPASYGFDVGYIWKPTSKMLVNMAYWFLHLDQEFVYVGDAGIVEPSGQTRRQGVDLSYRYQPFKWFFWNLDTNYTHARSIEDPAGENQIPLAPDFTLTSGLSFNFESGIYGGINIRYMDDRPANEDNSIVAEGFTIVDLNAGYKWKNLSFGVQVQNLFNEEWNEAQFATESRLQNETEPVEEIHFTPGAPFFIQGMIQYNF